VTHPHGVLGRYVLRAESSDAAALRALRELVVNADASGSVARHVLSTSAVDALHPLRAAGLVEADPSADRDAEAIASEDRIRLTPAARADLLEVEIEDGRDDLIDLIDQRILEIGSAAGAGAVLVAESAEQSAPPSADPFTEETPAPAAPADEIGGVDLPRAETETSDVQDIDVDPVPSVAGEPIEVPEVHFEPVGAREEELEQAGEARQELSTAADAPPAGLPEAEDGGVIEGGSTLSSRGLVKIYRKRRVVNEVDLYLRQGEIVGLLGPNGAGKTTTFYMVVGLIKPDRGRVFLGEEDVTSVPMYRRARRGIGYLAQEPSIFRKLTVEENVLAVLQMLGLARREQRRRLEELLDELGIKHLRHTKAYALSGGERRRLEITRALVGEPKFMLLDEPFAGVDPIAVHDIQQIVADLRRRRIGVLISDHNVEQTLDIVDRAYIMYDGRVRVSGTVSELVWNDEVAEIYLGPTLTARMRQRYLQPD
jgi:lipopolysaccharide export system ATP-binding protein